ncbi:MAG TPA: SRPBCC domain-containing protein [Gaiellaceae bacterium]|nr:SRPBCC domain-containing protein [Gaiellaceae bacterium]
MEIEREIVLDSPPEEVWPALTEAERLEEWFANDVELDARPGGRGVFRWDNGEERHAVVEELDPGRRLELLWDDTGRVELTLEEADGGTRLVVRETAPEWSAALELRALALCPTG